MPANARPASSAAAHAFRPPPGWVVRLVAVAVTIALAFAALKSDVRDVSTINAVQDRRLDRLDDQFSKISSDLGDLKGDVRAIRAVLDPKFTAR